MDSVRIMKEVPVKDDGDTDKGDEEGAEVESRKAGHAGCRGARWTCGESRMA